MTSRIEFSVVQARPEDVDSIVAIQSECGLSEWSARAYKDTIGKEEAITLTALGEDDYVLGFITGRVIKGSDGAQAEAEIHNIGVRVKFRQNRVGSALLRAFLDMAAIHRVESVWLDVRASNGSAVAFYRSHGFTGAGRRTKFYNRPEEDAEIMHLNVSPGR